MSIPRLDEGEWAKHKGPAQPFVGKDDILDDPRNPRPFVFIRVSSRLAHVINEYLKQSRHSLAEYPRCYNDEYFMMDRNLFIACMTAQPK
jgi:hypothetical protein